MWSKRNERRDVELDDEVCYRVYRMEITEVGNEAGANSVQIAEIESVE